MGQSPATRPSLLVQVRDSRDRSAWDRFVEIYGPFLFSYGRRHGLQEADASDLVQEVLSLVASTAPRFEYDPARGTFRGWLLTITRNQLRRIVRRGNRQALAAGGTTNLALLGDWPAVADPSAREREQELRQRRFVWAAGRVRGAFQASTWESFWKTAVENQPAEAVARGLGITVGAVYIARSRVLARLREVLASPEEEEEWPPVATSGRQGSGERG